MKTYSKKPDDSKATFIIVVVAFMLFFASGLVGIVSFRYKEIKCTEPAAAQIVRVDCRVAGKSREYIPHFIYYVDGQSYNGKAMASYSYLNKEGGYIGIKYNPDKPKMYIVPGDEIGYKTSWEIGIFLGAISLALIVCKFGKNLIDKKFS